MPRQRLRALTTGLLRLLIVVLLTLGSAVVYYRADAVRELVWLSAALIIGFVLDRWWTLFVAVLPWTLGVGTAWLTGHAAALDNWELITRPAEVVSSVGVGVFGIGVGILLRRWNRMPS